ncbi:MAG: chemotaxis protein CheW [Lachnospiraceae bacterium]|nr:chemotaxis protein CheW [Lachnospiraceae bacterium]MDD7026903.1 chemotaxis protein CheW [Lachnospiraceae bacterium]
MDNTKKFADVNQYIVISVGDEQFGIDIKYIDNIVKMQHITRVPNVASYIKGIINLRGEVIPVMSLRLKMGMENDVETKASRIIILRLEQVGMLGVIVDEVREVLTLEEDDVEKVVSDNKEERDSFVFAVGKYGESLVSLLDLNSVVAFD